MPLLKTRPDVAFFAPRLLEAGREHEARLVVQCRESLPVSGILVEFIGEEFWYTQSQYGRHGESSVFFRSSLVPFGKGELAAGEHTYDLRFEFPEGVPNSYRGRHVEISYTARVHIDIPWWPDVRARFVLNVRGATPPPPPQRRQVFVSALEGPHAGTPYFELSLSSHELEPGGRVRGSVALAGVESLHYEQLQATLWAVERVTGFLGAVEHFVRVAQWNLDVDRAERSQRAKPPPPPKQPIRHGSSKGPPRKRSAGDPADVVPLNLRLPSNLAVGFDHRRVALSWRLQVEAVIAWTADPSMMVPVYVRHRRPGEEEIESLPPAVGSKRQQLVWGDAGRRSGFDFADGELRRTAGKTEVRLRPESRRTGSWVVGEVHFVDLGLGLSFKNGRLRSREARQLEVLRLALGESFPLDALREVDDTRLRLERRGDRNVRPLVAFADQLYAVASAIEDARAQMPPPEALEPQLDAWRDAARRLGAELHVGPLALLAELDGHRVEIHTRFKPTGLPDHTTVVVTPPEPIPRRHHAVWRQGQSGDPPADVPVDTHLVQIGSDALRAELPSPLHDVALVTQTAEALLHAARRFVPRTGPYR